MHGDAETVAVQKCTASSGWPGAPVVKWLLPNGLPTGLPVTYLLRAPCRREHSSSSCCRSTPPLAQTSILTLTGYRGYGTRIRWYGSEEEAVPAHSARDTPRLLRSSLTSHQAAWRRPRSHAQRRGTSLSGDLRSSTLSIRRERAQSHEWVPSALSDALLTGQRIPGTDASEVGGWGGVGWGDIGARACLGLLKLVWCGGGRPQLPGRVVADLGSALAGSLLETTTTRRLQQPTTTTSHQIKVEKERSMQRRTTKKRVCMIEEEEEE